MTKSTFQSVVSAAGAYQGELAALQRDWPPEIPMWAGDTLSPVHAAYPYLFLGAFPAVRPEAVRRLALTGQLFANSITVSDTIIDEDPEADPALFMLRVIADQHEAYVRLNALFPPTARFWSRFRAFLVEYASACMRELRLRRGDEPWDRFTERDAIDIAKGKTAVAKAVVAGLAELAHDDGPLTPLTSSIDEYNIALQYLDDLKDWRQDIDRGAPSLLVSRLLPRANAGAGAVAALSDATPGRIAHEVYYRGPAQHMLDSALHHIGNALVQVTDLEVKPWRDVLETVRDRTLSMREDLASLVDRNLRSRRPSPPRIRLPAERSRWDALAWGALDDILLQWRRGFGEARHIMRFPRAGGFTGAGDYQYGDVFQRAIIADALCDANEVLDGQLTTVIDDEAEYLLGSRLEEAPGGWSYFPRLPELPPDADDLAQVMQVLLRSGRRAAVDAHAREPLHVLLSDGMHADGSFETWIIPANGRSLRHDRQVQYARKFWGRGADPEVVANLVFALQCYDRHRYGAVIGPALEYLEAAQAADGSWRSTWYFGPYYGTYVCLRALAEARPKSPAVAAGARFLQGMQRADGAWPDPEQTDSGSTLSTALALLGLRAASRTTASEAALGACALRAGDRLARRLSEGDAWPAAPFIRMEIGRAEGTIRSVASYSSRTITAAYVLKAMLALRPL